MHCTSTKIGVDSSSHFQFRTWTLRPANRHTVTDKTDCPTHTIQHNTAVLLAGFFKNKGQKQDKNLENIGQFTGHIETYVATLSNEQSLRSEQLSSLSHKNTSIAIPLHNDQQKMHNSIFVCSFM